MAYSDTLSTDLAFARYEDVRHRFPAATFPAGAVFCSGLVEIAEEFDAFLLDSFGVLNVGDRPIAGATDCIARLRRMGKRLIVLTNAASYTRDAAIERYRRLGFDFSADEVVSSRDVATSHLNKIAPGARWGAIAAPEDRFEDIDADVVHWDGGACDAVLLLSSAALSAQLMDSLAEALRKKPMPVVVANPDLVAPRENGLSKEPGYFAHLLADQLNIEPLFFGKPFGNAFDEGFSRLHDIPSEQVAMVGDTLHTDILGGRAVGTRTVLVRDHGLFAGTDVDAYVNRSGIIPDYQCSSI